MKDHRASPTLLSANIEDLQAMDSAPPADLAARATARRATQRRFGGHPIAPRPGSAAPPPAASTMHTYSKRSSRARQDVRLLGKGATAASLGDFAFDLLSPPPRPGKPASRANRKAKATKPARKAAPAKRRVDPSLATRRALVEIAATSVTRKLPSAQPPPRERGPAPLGRSGSTPTATVPVTVSRLRVAADSDSSVSPMPDDEPPAVLSPRTTANLHTVSSVRRSASGHGALGAASANSAWHATTRASSSMPSRAGSRGRRVAFRAHAQLQDKVTYRILSPPANVREVNRVRAAIAVEAADAAAARAAGSPRRFLSPLRARRLDKPPAAPMAILSEDAGPPSLHTTRKASQSPALPAPPARCADSVSETASDSLPLADQAAGDLATSEGVPTAQKHGLPLSPSRRPSCQPAARDTGSPRSHAHGAVGRLSKLPRASASQCRKRDRLVGQAERSCRPSPPLSPIASPIGEINVIHPLRSPRALADDPSGGAKAKVSASLGSPALPCPPAKRQTHRPQVAPARRRQPRGMWKALEGMAGAGASRPVGPGSLPTCGGFLTEELEGWGMLLGVNARKRSLDDSLAPWGIELPIPT